VERTLKALFTALFNKYTPYEIPVTKEMMTRDFKMQKKLQADELDVKSVTTEFYLAMTSAMNKVYKMASEIKTPVYLLQAAEDHVVDVEAVKDFFNCLDSRTKEFTLLDKFYHSLSVDKDKEFVYELIRQWLERVLFVIAGPRVP
jgi:alpha-beta hydrolase superfamily lysophospholipase